MASRKLRFAIFGNTYQPKKSESFQKLLACLTLRRAEVLIEREFYTFLTEEQKLPIEGVTVFDLSDFYADFVISMGGDGTFLRAASMVGNKNIPILGVNTGRLGFLADVNALEIEHTINALYEGDYAIDTRAVIRVETDGQQLTGFDCALNDVAILKRDNASMISIHMTINGDYVTTYQADGLIISTPTGSTAYSLSNGGPIIVPGTHVFSLTAVAPHSLNVRPIVLSEDSEIKLTVESRTHNYLVALDGRSEKLVDTTRLTLRKAPYRVKVIKRAGTKYFHTLREKMMWGADSRK
ncbi:NAD+ kinase [Prevotellaceae bacterium HUN156]|jgi:NAD+ kinase|nr:NAD+ kinase [Prevotellaceae bacterium HUN156]